MNHLTLSITLLALAACGGCSASSNGGDASDAFQIQINTNSSATFSAVIVS
jgi:hypothetical protein